VDGTVVYKMTGSGNDFVMLDGRNQRLGDWTPERIRAICARGTGIGADGLAVLEPGSGPAAVRFNFFNSDGGRSAMCGNAALCATRLACWLEMAPAEGLTLETDSGEVRARCLHGPGERAEILLPAIAQITVPDIAPAPGERSIHLTAVGVPHLVVLVEDVAAVALMERGRDLRCHPAVGADGANVNFVGTGSGEWRMRTYERGVEAETLACGTGAAAAAAVLSRVDGVTPPVEIRTSSGALLTVSADPASDGGLGRPRLEGEGRLVFRACRFGRCRHDDAVGTPGRTSAFLIPSCVTHWGWRCCMPPSGHPGHLSTESGPLA
jgi:diaminopimelate epimerase